MKKPRTSFAQLLLILPLLALVGCDSITGDDDDITGTWTATSDGSTEYLVITDTDVTVYTSDTGDTCFEQFNLDIISSTGDTYTLREAGSSFTADVVIRRSGDNLEVESEGESMIYSPTNANVSELDICAGGGDGDTSTACTQLEQITVGGTATGTLSTTDATAPSGAFYDLYGLQLSSQQEVQIDLSSNEIDTYLYLYESNGTLVASNDDAGETYDSSLTVTLSSGCYRIEASSYDAGETGSYTLSVN